MKAITLFAALLLGYGPVAGQCTKPTISSPVATSDVTGQNLTVTWTTSVPADSLVAYGAPNPGTLVPVSDTSGVTSHSVTIAGLVPGLQYGYGIRSQAINAGVGCGTGYYGFQFGLNATMAAAPAGSFTYGLKIIGGTYATQGNGVYLEVYPYTLTGSYSTTGLQILITGLPTGATVNWSGANNHGGLFPIENDTQSATTVNYDTVQVQHYNWYPQEVNILTTSATPVGNYTLTFTASAINGSGYPTVVAMMPLHVVSSAAPFSGIPLAQGTPTAYPPIPDLATYLLSASTYGAQSCAQDLDASPRTIRPNDQANLVHPATCCTYDSWFYDGVQVYSNVQKLLTGTQYDGQQWSICQANVKQVYDPYVLGAPVPVYMTFTKGFYNDYWVTGDPNDISLINYVNTHDLPTPYHAYWVDVGNLQRETAYTLRNLTHGTLLGQTPGGFGILNAAGMRSYALDHVLNHIDQMCLSQNATYYENFMSGLDAMELLDYYQLVTPDPRIPPALACLANWMYSTQWQAIDNGAFPYDKEQLLLDYSLANGSTDCMQTLNQMISPMYAWLFKYTGDPSWQVKGDSVWDHGVLFDCAPLPVGPASYLTMRFDSDGKSFSQNYGWGNSYVIWRSPPR